MVAVSQCDKGASLKSEKSFIFLPRICSRDTDGLIVSPPRPLSTTHQWPLDAVACGPRALLMCALLMTPSHSQAVNLNKYKVGSVLQKIGVLPAGDMTIEATATKSVNSLY